MSDPNTQPDPNQDSRRSRISEFAGRAAMVAVIGGAAYAALKIGDANGFSMLPHALEFPVAMGLGGGIVSTIE